MTKRKDKYYQDVVHFCRTHREDVMTGNAKKDEGREQWNYRVWLLYYVGLIETWDIIFRR